MRAALSVAGDLLREASSRRWFLALGIGVTMALVVIGSALQLEVVDGALAATRLFGKELGRGEIRSVDVALRYVGRALAYVAVLRGPRVRDRLLRRFRPEPAGAGAHRAPALRCPCGGSSSCSARSSACSRSRSSARCTAPSGSRVIFGLRAGVWMASPIVALLASVTFAGIYGAMLTTAVMVRSAALSAAVGIALFILGIVAGYREQLDSFFEPGLARGAFRAATLVLPRVSALADASAEFAVATAIKGGCARQPGGGAALFGLAALAVGIHVFEEKDFWGGAAMLDEAVSDRHRQLRGAWAGVTTR